MTLQNASPTVARGASGKAGGRLAQISTPIVHHKRPNGQDLTWIDPYPSIPAELKTRPQWAAATRDKVPVNPRTGGNAQPNNPATWGTYRDAVNRAQRDGLLGVGYITTEDDPYTFCDLDKCVTDGVPTDRAQALIDGLYSYSEYSQSRTGVHVIVRATLPGNRGRKASGVELYNHRRFMIFTGAALPDCPATIEPRQNEIDQLLAVVFGNRKPSGPAQPAQPTNLDDHKIVDLARNAGNGAKFDRLWSGNANGYSSSSEADLALCAILAFWTGGDERRIDDLFRQSGLYRDKWLEVHAHDGRTYGQMTIGKALEGLTAYYTPGACHHDHDHEPEPAPEDWEPTANDWRQCSHCARWWHKLAHDGRFIVYHHYCGNKNCAVFKKIRTRRYLSPALGWGNVYITEVDDRDYRAIRDLVEGDYIGAPQPSGRVVVASETPTPYSVSMPVQMALERLETAIDAIPADKRIRRRQGKRQRPTEQPQPRDKTLDGRLRPGELKIILQALGAVGVELRPFRAALKSVDPLTTEQVSYVKTVIDALQAQPWGKVSSIDTLPLETHTVPVDAQPAPPVFLTPHHAAEWYHKHGRKVPRLEREALE